MKVYFDTSALARRYLADEGGAAVLKLLREHAQDAFTSELALLELSSAFRKAQNAGRVKSGVAQSLVHQAAADLSAMQVGRLDTVVVTRACQLALHQDLRALDAIHLATALEASCDAFVAGDKELLQAAKREGLHSISV